MEDRPARLMPSGKLVLLLAIVVDYDQDTSICGLRMQSLARPICEAGVAQEMLGLWAACRVAKPRGGRWWMLRDCMRKSDPSGASRLRIAPVKGRVVSVAVNLQTCWSFARQKAE